MAGVMGLGACSQNAALEVTLTLPAESASEPLWAVVSVGRSSNRSEANAFAPRCLAECEEGEVPTDPSERQDFAFSLLTENFAEDVHLWVDFCEAEGCDVPRASVAIVLAQPFYEGGRTAWNLRMPTTPETGDPPPMCTASSASSWRCSIARCDVLCTDVADWEDDEGGHCVNVMAMDEGSSRHWCEVSR